MTSNGERSSGLLHPVALAALALWIVNDHVLKWQCPCWLTGKLSDVAGMIVFPLVLRALLRVDVRACVVATGLGFAAVKLFAPATAAFAHVVGWLQWPWTHTLESVAIVRDPTDLLALPALAIAWWIGVTAASAAPAAGACRRQRA